MGLFIPLVRTLPVFCPVLALLVQQVQTYMDHYCNNTTNKRILLMFLNICCELHKLCQRLESLHPGNATTNAILEKCKMYVSHSNDLSGLRAKYPHDVVNHLSCDEARNHYGGVVSLIPIVLDCMKEWVAHTEKLPRNMLQSNGTTHTHARCLEIKN
uniref:Sperm acrosome associated 9 n=1 Tax=Pseudonaja textilis TaxID=8673 RepID=A0A670ZGU4_PSETE